MVAFFCSGTPGCRIVLEYFFTANPRRAIDFSLAPHTALSRAPAWRRRGLLAALGAAHVLAFLLWPAPQRPAHAPVAGLNISWLMPVAPPRAAPRPSAPAPKRQPGTSARPERPSVAVAPAAAQPSAPQPISAPSVPAPDPFAPAPVAEDLRQSMRRSAGAVDRQLRKDSWNPRDKTIANDSTVLAAKFAGAYAGHGDGTRFEQVAMPDGRMMTKVHTPGGGTYCAFQESNGLTGGRDPFRDGNKVKVMTCPN